MDAYSPCLTLQRPRGARSRNRKACVTEKRSLTNRIRGQFARIKAAGSHRYQLWLLRKMRRNVRSPRATAGGQKRQHNRRNRKEQCAQQEPGPPGAPSLLRASRGETPAPNHDGDKEDVENDRGEHGGSCRCVQGSIQDRARRRPSRSRKSGNQRKAKARTFPRGKSGHVRAVG